MDSLIKLLGPAPSEMSPDELMSLIKRERARALAFRPRVQKARPKTVKKSSKKTKESKERLAIIALLKGKGIAEKNISKVLSEAGYDPL